jgi:glycosyltransferase involved in cell wall biosynthesis
MAAGLPVIASDVNSVKEIVGSGGVVFPKDDYIALSNVLKSFIHSPKRIKHLGSKARTIAKSKYSWSKIVPKYLSI